MAGIWDRITGEDSLPIHFVTSALLLGADGEFTNQNILDALNAGLTTPLDSAAETDLLNIKNNITGTAGAQAKYLHQLESIMIAKESGQYNNEAGFRAYLGIT